MGGGEISSIRKSRRILRHVSGTTDPYCGTGCQSGYGSCTGSATASLTTFATTVTSKAPSSTSLAKCLNEKSVPIYLPGSSQYEQRAKPYNLRSAYEPAVIVLPTATQHISDAVICAGKSNVKVQVSFHLPCPILLRPYADSGFPAQEWRPWIRIVQHWRQEWIDGH